MTITAPSTTTTDIVLDRQVRRYVERHLLLAVRKTVGYTPSPEQATQRLPEFVLDSSAAVFEARRLRHNDFEGPKVTPAHVVEERRRMRALPDFWERSFSTVR